MSSEASVAWPELTTQIGGTEFALGGAGRRQKGDPVKGVVNC
jgi:hypothetical protein